MIYNLREMIYNLRKSVKSLFRQHIKTDLLIFDDIFPNIYSDWRYNEYVFYLDNIKNCAVVTGINDSLYLKKTGFDYFEKFTIRFPHYQKKIFQFDINTDYSGKICYCLFYNNLKKIFPVIKTHNLPFIFTLYPGGGFRINDIEIEKNLEMFFSSHLFRHVIVNMPHVHEYLINRFQLTEHQISYIYGAPIEMVKNREMGKKLNSSKIRIVFSAHKYSVNGADKGFDVFNLVAKYFENDNRFEFFCIGGFNKSDFLTHTDNLTFVGNISPEKLVKQYMQYDIIVSPNRSNVLHFGSFDGFPTGTVIHACNSGLMMMLTDDWSNAERIGLVEGEDFILIKADVDSVVESLLKFTNRKDIKKVALNGRNKLTPLFANINQLDKRLEIISQYIK